MTTALSAALRALWPVPLAAIAITSTVSWFAQKDAPFDDSWIVVSPESEGMASTALTALDPILEAHGTDAWLVVQRIRRIAIIT